MASAGRGISLTPGSVVGAGVTAAHPKEEQWPDDVDKLPITSWDTGVFLTELSSLNRMPAKLEMTDEERFAAHMNPEASFQKVQDNIPPPIAEGTYRGTQLALTKMCQQIEASYASFMDTTNFQPSIPHPLSIKQKRQLFSFTDPATDGYPPHLNLAGNRSASDMNPGELQKSTLTRVDLFNKMRLAQMTALMPQLLPRKFIPSTMVALAQGQAKLAFGDMGRPDEGRTLKDVEDYQRHQRAKSGGLFDRNEYAIR